MSVSQCGLTKLFPYILFEKYINILALKMASPDRRTFARSVWPSAGVCLRPSDRSVRRWPLLPCAD